MIFSLGIHTKMKAARGFFFLARSLIIARVARSKETGVSKGVIRGKALEDQRKAAGCVTK